MITDDEYFMQAILANPTDDIPRLLYADWLEEQGDPRGEFIRVQIEISRIGGVSTPETEGEGDIQRLVQLRARENELLLQASLVPGLSREHCLHWHLWSPGGAEGWGHLLNISNFPGGILFRRGFVEKIQLSHNLFIERAALLFRSAPVTEVVLTDRLPAHIEREPGFPPWTWCDHVVRPPPVLCRQLWLLVGKGWFATAEEAQQSLSVACVAYGRRQARKAVGV